MALIHLFVSFVLLAASVKAFTHKELHDMFGAPLGRQHAHTHKVAPKAVAASAATGFSYVQYVVFDNKDCTGEVIEGGAYQTNTCFLLGYGNPSNKTDAYYSTYLVASSGMVSVGIYNVSTCTGTPIYENADIGSVGCTVDGSFGIRTVQTQTPLWPQGQNGASVKIHATGVDCNTDNGFAYNFNAEQYATFDSCMNVTTLGPNPQTVSVQVTSCSSSANNGNGNYTFNFFGTTDCTGPSQTQTGVWGTDFCNSPIVFDNFVYGYVSFSCADGPKHNKCYENFGISSPACDASLTKSALKFMCTDPGYTGCATRFLDPSKQNGAEIFGCCI